MAGGGVGVMGGGEWEGWMQQVADGVVLFADLVKVKETSIEHLSGGELQRFACAVVCVQYADM